MASLASPLAPGTAGGLVWSVTFILVGLVGLVGLAESMSFLRAPDGPKAVTERTLRSLDTLLYAAMVSAAFTRDALGTAGRRWASRLPRCAAALRTLAAGLPRLATPERWENLLVV